MSLDRLEYTGQAVDEKEPMGIGLESDSTAIGRNLDQPKWLKPGSTTDTKSSLTGVSAPVSDLQPSMPSTGSDDDIPDFLRQAGWKNSSGEFKEGVSSFEEEAPSTTTSPAIQGDLPDWVKALAPTDEEESASH